jgi:alkylhydroperoxidase family enzyme
MDIRRAVGAKAGIPSEKLDDLLRYRESDRFTARERAALEYAERITRDDLDVTDACTARLREHFTEAEVVELTFIVGFQTFASKFAKAFLPKWTPESEAAAETRRAEARRRRTGWARLLDRLLPA